MGILKNLNKNPKGDESEITSTSGTVEAVTSMTAGADNSADDTSADSALESQVASMLNPDPLGGLNEIEAQAAASPSLTTNSGSPAAATPTNEAATTPETTEPSSPESNDDSAPSAENPEEEPTLALDDLPDYVQNQVARMRKIWEDKVASGELSQDDMDRLWGDFEANVLFRLSSNLNNIEASRAAVAKSIEDTANGMGGGGGILSRLFGSNPQNAYKDINRRQEAAIDEFSSGADNYMQTIRNRVSSVRQDKDRMARQAMQTLAVGAEASRREFDDAVIDSEGFAKAVTPFAQQNGMALEDVVRMFKRGERPEAAVQAVQAASGEIMADPVVASAAEQVDNLQGKLLLNMQRAADNANMMVDGSDVEAEMARETLDESAGIAESAVGETMLDTPKKKEFEQRMREMAQNIAESIRRMLANMAARFGSAAGNDNEGPEASASPVPSLA